MPIEFYVFYIAVLIFSVVIHEVSHGTIANRLGDPTAKFAGRLTLNPIKHLDLWGSIILPVFLILVRSPILFGWAKPVPYNPYNLKNQKWGPAMVAAAGPASNLLLAVFFGLIIRLAGAFDQSGFFGLLAGYFQIIVFLNLTLAIFNLLPIPPLDGSKVLFAALPYSYEHIRVFLEQYGLVILLFVLFFGGNFIFPVIRFLFQIITGTDIF
ncbi:MAG: hypothetical protein UX53_C0013G0007 [Candidatus Azambacteria bacterium GW2011_GWB2_46_37]|uniref:Peptidase M50 domain-containing protein n=7 Tax=Candidatus Azamiibacteriota TaxID=1752741 RepID=A0A0G1QCR6_9BACT|nr:MAG: hypothetical protein UX27_C0005G0002 [Candidatus Azambacteria bacterium GW2011_GWA2_45_90]KKU21951.1 MAG: hypothetical protein UX33_C0018G0010 [Candidatus Azambacteria bacterium GW2011_GWC1_46_13]KKU36215.1 MAG: hypothetical protein UX48_C0010G0013 [Candidatus Azambacteria bacterium GW2011_GWB1_46_27]KKU37956.1 MAG: hypothetical protein UX51_C0009G0015 [Candidatus Azambacteria bacterium GW2011_GWF2_46_32]KKU39149.1 MAG: hypothetical protein UX53_C0013G0007 [Candidatus Azambacteria bacte